MFILTVRDLRRILEEFKDDDIINIHDTDTNENFLVEDVNIDSCIEGYFEININTTNPTAN